MDKSLPGDAGNRVTCARQDGCVIAYREVCLGRMVQVRQTPRASAPVTTGSTVEAARRAESLNLVTAPLVGAAWKVEKPSRACSACDMVEAESYKTTH